jgi:hypothetical protein
VRRLAAAFRSTIAPPEMTLETFLRRLSNAGLFLAVLFIAVFAADYLVFRIRVAAHGVDSVSAKITTYDAALLKDNKLNVYFDQPQIQICVRSIFPWYGYDPCWYLQRHTVKVVN